MSKNCATYVLRVPMLHQSTFNMIWHQVEFIINNLLIKTF